MAAFIFVAKPETKPGDVQAGIKADWSCSAKAKAGDRAYLYVTGGTGISAEWQIISGRGEKKGQYYRCGVRFFREIAPPITIKEIKFLAPGWPPAQQNLRGHHAVELPLEVAEAIAFARPVPAAVENAELERAVAESLALSRSERAARLKEADPKPHKVQTIQPAFQRNPDVIAAVLERANGRCERCGKNGPFISRVSGKPYLEVHHRIRLADGGDDTVENATALCPNCHRHEHYA